MAPKILTSVATPRFWTSYRTLPPNVQSAAKAAYRLWRTDPQHPSLHFKPLKGHKDRFSVRVGLHYRALARIDGATVTWVWIGTHADYDKLIS